MQQNVLQTMVARDLRQNMTKAEHWLWNRLRDRRFMGLKFRRKAPIGPYVVDFLCVERRLILDLDLERDPDPASAASRLAWLRSQGFDMLLVSRGDMLANPAGCLRYLSDWVSEAGQASRLDAGRKIDLGTDRTFRANVAGDQAGPVA